MVVRKDDSLQSISVQLDGKNYSYWSYVMKIFLKGKSMWGYVTGTKMPPTDKAAETYATMLDIWEADNSKIITWIKNSVTHSIGVQLAKYDTSKHLETDIRALKQNDLCIQDFYSAMSDLWDQLALTESEELRVLTPYITHREQQRLVQFLAALRSNFETLRGSILHRNPLPSVDLVVHELIAEEIRIKTRLDKEHNPTSTSFVLATPHNPSSNHPNRLNSRVAMDECAFCKKKGHWKGQCPLLINKGKQPHQQQQSQPQQQSQRRPQQLSSHLPHGNLQVKHSKLVVY
ncbi:uncharacterized protein LOC124946290 [Impatiens glandulifera]|uniref:uncharacterized protein LOC124946290 n=1 Tax=Impatiens glandulifera TaxID=253017 RepID=UPI001FB17022|nr:uncharacterized protein LOC124946290 [Impatiens glandulifera]